MTFSETLTEQRREKNIAAIAEKIAGWLTRWEEEAGLDGRVGARMEETARIMHALHESGMEMEEIASRLNFHGDNVRILIGHRDSLAKEHREDKASAASTKEITQKEKDEFVRGTAEYIFDWILACADRAYEKEHAFASIKFQAELIHELFASGMTAEEIGRRIGMEELRVRDFVDIWSNCFNKKQGVDREEGTGAV